MGRRRKRVSRKTCRCSFYINTNVLLSGLAGSSWALGFLREHGMVTCFSNILGREIRRGRELGYNVSVGGVKRFLFGYGLCMYKTRVRGKTVLSKCGVLGVDPEKYFYDVYHVLVARELGAVFVTADKRAASIAKKLKVRVFFYDIGRGVWIWL